MTDTFSTYDPGMDGPAEHGFAITAATSPLDYTTRALWVAASGTLNVTMSGGETVAIAGIAAGTMLPIRVTHVLATGTSTGLAATGVIIGFY